MSDNEPQPWELKRMAAEAALRHVTDGMLLGLGSGSTAEIFVNLLAEQVAAGLNVRCCATSERTAQLARERGIYVRELDQFSQLDLCIDGADEIDPSLNLIKGGGACHLREKVVASFAANMIVIADESKLVHSLGAFRIPLEVVSFALPLIHREIAVLGGQGSVRMHGEEPVRTDEGNLVVDADFGLISDAPALDGALSRIPGLVEHGLFIGLTSLAIIGTRAGPRELRA